MALQRWSQRVSFRNWNSSPSLSQLKPALILLLGESEPLFADGRTGPAATCTTMSNNYFVKPENALKRANGACQPPGPHLSSACCFFRGRATLSLGPLLGSAPTRKWRAILVDEPRFRTLSPAFANPGSPPACLVSSPSSSASFYLLLTTSPPLFPPLPPPRPSQS